jgi:hypothetical protein
MADSTTRERSGFMHCGFVSPDSRLSIDRGRSDDAFDTVLRASDATSGPKCMMISAKMRCGSCFVNFNVVLIASMFVLASQFFA